LLCLAILAKLLLVVSAYSRKTRFRINVEKTPNISIPKTQLSHNAYYTMLYQTIKEKNQEEYTYKEAYFCNFAELGQELAKRDLEFKS